ncbi:hypothetical protein TNIN_352771 [Trichonephila inaurata madagascariensis]|uniref:Uncharacterized protein n=1 Tax=Trichonephila inaurata madagascariensis TaxID=2747483 RepID=A0A8X6YGV0_9ARAC|nr:hypothetical protein TNIN_352771 [Trichonephila inaurata madagascariensis]
MGFKNNSKISESKVKIQSSFYANLSKSRRQWRKLTIAGFIRSNVCCFCIMEKSEKILREGVARMGSMRAQRGMFLADTAAASKRSKQRIYQILARGDDFKLKTLKKVTCRDERRI